MMYHPGRHRRALVVCPTPFGGQIEHAADAALALASRPETDQVVLLSRPGAGEYLDLAEIPGLRVVEDIPPSRPAPSARILKPLHAALQVFDLVREHVRIRRLATRAGDNAVLVLDSGKYPFPRTLRGSPAQTLVLFVHNARPHFTSAETSPRRRFILALEHACARRVDRIITHGVAQQRIIQEETLAEVVSVQLPVSSRLSASTSQQNRPGEAAVFLHHEPYALCIGEVRSNKGVEQAIAAATAAGVPLRVHGKSEDKWLGAQLTQLAAESGVVVFEDRFLARTEFDELIRHAAVVVLPYLHFDAQSGVLSRAMQMGARVVASDLRALRGQAGDYTRMTFADVHDAKAFGAAMKQALEDAVQPRSGRAHGSFPNDHKDWDLVASAILGVPASVSSGTSSRRRRSSDPCHSA